MKQIERGDVVWAQLDPVKGREQAKTRPVLVLTEPEFATATGRVIAVPTTTKNSGPESLALVPLGLKTKSWAIASQVRTLSLRRLGKRVGAVIPNVCSRVVEDLTLLIGG